MTITLQVINPPGEGWWLRTLQWGREPSGIMTVQTGGLARAVSIGKVIIVEADWLEFAQGIVIHWYSWKPEMQVWPSLQIQPAGWGLNTYIPGVIFQIPQLRDGVTYEIDCSTPATMGWATVSEIMPSGETERQRLIASINSLNEQIAAAIKWIEFYETQLGYA